MAYGNDTVGCCLQSSVLTENFHKKNELPHIFSYLLFDSWAFTIRYEFQIVTPLISPSDEDSRRSSIRRSSATEIFSTSGLPRACEHHLRTLELAKPCIISKRIKLEELLGFVHAPPSFTNTSQPPFPHSPTQVGVSMPRGFSSVGVFCSALLLLDSVLSN